jgi:hypothetical protein
MRRERRGKTIMRSKDEIFKEYIGNVRNRELTPIAQLSALQIIAEALLDIRDLLKDNARSV